MKVLLLAINSKYIHPNLAIRLLKANTEYPVDTKEFTIKDTNEKIISFVNEGSYDVVGISCYIWNIEKVKEILPQIKATHIFLGGPEVSYNAEYYLDNNLCEYVIKNEGEEAFDMLLKYFDNKVSLNEIPNLYYKGGFTYNKLVDVSKTKMAYDQYDDLHNKIAYIETSRGCPYHCGYCMASLDNKLRFFDMDQIKNQILMLQSKGARVYKFLDRTFNANKKFVDLIDFIVLNHKDGESYQFEITGDLLKEEYIDYINNHAPRNLIRFEIGIQSTNKKSNLAVGRIQNNEKLFSNIIKIQDANIIDLHLDLIAGLPYEDYESFIKTFNDCLALRPKELQLGFLKILYGTALFNCKEEYGYKYSDKAPYEIISNSFLSEDDLNEIHFTEDAFDHYYNSGIFKKALSFVLDNENNPFMFFNKLGHNMKKGNLETQFKVLDELVKEKDYYEEFHELLINDYLIHFNLKPAVWWDEKESKHDKNELFRQIAELNDSINLNDCYKYGLLISLKNTIIIAIYKVDERIIYQIDKESLLLK